MGPSASVSTSRWHASAVVSHCARSSKAGIGYDTARAVEAGNLQTGLGATLAMLWAMGLESEINAFVNPERDDEGKQLEIARLPQRVRHAKERLDGEF